MKKHLIPIGAILLALFISGCETDGGVTARIQEKSAVYATLPQPEKDSIAKGNVMPGFTPDMVYMAVGRPSRVEPVKLSDGNDAEIWTYNNYFPPGDADLKGLGFNSGSPGPASTMDSTELKGFTLQIEFHGGKVARLALKHA